MPFFEYYIRWHQPANIGPVSFKCGYCGDKVGGFLGWFGSVEGRMNNGQGRVYICTSCSHASFFLVGVSPGSNDVNVLLQSPPPAYGEEVRHLPNDVEDAYAEARACYMAEAFSAAVMMCRKLLMHIAVDKAGAAAGDRFVAYLNALENGGFIAPPNRPWLEKIRELGNEANHELAAISREQAEMAIDFVAMLLKTLYEYPYRAS